MCLFNIKHRYFVLLNVIIKNISNFNKNTETPAAQFIPIVEISQLMIAKLLIHVNLAHYSRDLAKTDRRHCNYKHMVTSLS